MRFVLSWFNYTIKSIKKKLKMNKDEKEFYTLKELKSFTELHYRALQNRIKVVSNKYQNRTELIYKYKNKWFIHNSLISEFKKDKLPIEYKLFITIASGDKLDKAYWKYILFRINSNLKQLDTSTRTKYVIELTRNNIYHLHFITTYNNIKILNKILKDDFLTSNMNIHTQEITKLDNLHKYIRKENKPILLNKKK